MDEKVVDDLQNALNETWLQPGMETVTWVTLVRPAVTSLEQTAGDINEVMFEWVQRK